jgi:hypothetical protein
LRDIVLIDRIDGAPGFHAIDLRVDAVLFYQPVNDRAPRRTPSAPALIVSDAPILEFA